MYSLPLFVWPFKLTPTTYQTNWIIRIDERWFINVISYNNVQRLYGYLPYIHKYVFISKFIEFEYLLHLNFINITF